MTQWVCHLLFVIRTSVTTASQPVSPISHPQMQHRHFILLFFLFRSFSFFNTRPFLSYILLRHFPVELFYLSHPLTIASMTSALYSKFVDQPSLEYNLFYYVVHFTFHLNVLKEAGFAWRIRSKLFNIYVSMPLKYLAVIILF